MTLMDSKQLFKDQQVSLDCSAIMDALHISSTPSLPNEVLDLIFKFYMSEQNLLHMSRMMHYQAFKEKSPRAGRLVGSDNGLLNCALVCKQWAVCAIPAMYRHPIVAYGKIDRFLRSLCIADSPASLVRYLTIHPSPRRPEERVGDGCQEIHKDFAQVFDYLPSLQSLVIRDAKILNLVDADRLFVGLKKTSPAKVRLEIEVVCDEPDGDAWLKDCVEGYTLGEVIQNAKSPHQDNAAVSNTDLAEPLPAVTPRFVADYVGRKFKPLAEKISDAYYFNGQPLASTNLLLQKLYRASQNALVDEQRTLCTLGTPTTTLRWHLATMLEKWRPRLVAISLCLDGAFATQMVVYRKFFDNLRVPHVRLRLQPSVPPQKLFNGALQEIDRPFLVTSIQSIGQKSLPSDPALHEDVQLFELELDQSELTDEMMDEAITIPVQVSRILKGSRPWEDVRTEPGHSSMSDDEDEPLNNIPDWDIYGDDDDDDYQSDASTESNVNPFYESSEDEE